MKKYLAGLLGGLFALIVAYILAMTFVQNPEIQLLPFYTLSTISRITITLIISIIWGVFFGILAATNRIASIILIPFIDLLQSVPILGYFPMVLFFFLSLGAIGMELAAIVLLFTSMAWAIFFGVVGAIRGIPTNISESARSFGLTGFKYVRHVILPAILPALVSGATLAWCDGWFFMIAAEYVQYGVTADVPPKPIIHGVPGLGSFLAKAAYNGDTALSVVLLGLITFIVIYINFLTWHKLMDKAATGTYKPILKIDLSGVGKLGTHIPMRWLHLREHHFHWPRPLVLASMRLRKYSRLEKAIALGLMFFIVLFLIYASHENIQQAFSMPPAGDLVFLPVYIGLTMGRLTVAYLISLGLALGMGVLAAEHKKFAVVFYPLYDVGQAVPILALFPVLFIALSKALGGSLGLEVTCIVMLVLDMIWYMFLNIVTAIKNIPSEMSEVGRLFGFKGIKRVTHLVIPSILPAIVTGSILSWGTGWNTIIFAEYMPYLPNEFGEPLRLPGLGSYLELAGSWYGNTVLLLFLLGIVAFIVLLMEGLVWRRLLRKFEKYRIEV